MDRYYQNQKTEETTVEKPAKKPKLLLFLLNLSVSVLTVAGLTFLSEKYAPEIYNNAKNTYDNVAELRAKAVEWFGGLTEKAEDLPVFSEIFAEEEKELVVAKGTQMTAVSKLDEDIPIRCCPVNSGTILSDFGENTDENGVTVGKTGIEIGVPLGSQVYAFEKGTVTKVENGRVEITHQQGLRSVYDNLLCPLCAVGQQVEAGKRIGLSGQKEECAQIYFEIVLDGIPQNPLEYIEVW